MPNVALPGQPRYQPKDLVAFFGYDNLARVLVEVEIAAMRTLGDLNVIKAKDIALLTPEVEEKLLSIPMTQVDTIERQITKHDIRALVMAMQDIMPGTLKRWIHVPLTSYDVIDTARAILFSRVHDCVLRPKTDAVIELFRDQALRHMEIVQIGRTHGQHALPITVGFWFATILNRVLYNASRAETNHTLLVGKISGAVGAYNAQDALGITERANTSFEEMVLQRLGIKPAPISTQIGPPEPMAYYLFSCAMLSAALGQFGRDGRNLMRTEIGELAEPFGKDQTGSSTMAHKRNPMTFENIESMWWRTKNELGKVLDTLISEHQRDLVGSALMRDFPIIIVNLVEQLDRLLARDKETNTPFLSRITIDTEACQRNVRMQGDRILAEPFYLVLQMYGYEGDAHKVINHEAIPRVGVNARNLYEAVEQVTHLDDALAAAWANVPKEIKAIFREPAHYTGLATRKTREICEVAQAYLAHQP